MKSDFLTKLYGPSYILPKHMRNVNDGKGVQFPRGPAAVTEDEPRGSHCPDLVMLFGWEGVG